MGPIGPGGPGSPSCGGDGTTPVAITCGGWTVTIMGGGGGVSGGGVSGWVITGPIGPPIGAPPPVVGGGNGKTGPIGPPISPPVAPVFGDDQS
jgi:hypothetical protein